MSNAELIAAWEYVLESPELSQYARGVISELIEELRALDA